MFKIVKNYTEHKYNKYLVSIIYVLNIKFFIFLIKIKLMKFNDNLDNERTELIWSLVKTFLLVFLVMVILFFFVCQLLIK